MAKFAEKEEKPFSPISHKLIDAISAPPKPQEVEEEPAQTKVVEMRPQGDSSPRREPPPEHSEETEPFVSEERLTRMMRYMVSDEEKKDIEEFLHRLSQAAEVNLTHSNIMRACRDVLFQAEEQLVIELTRAKLKRPINDKRAIAFFESRLSEIIQKSIRERALPYQRRGGRGEGR
jgi:hypothetical protein